MRGYKQLTEIQRYQIQEMRRFKIKLRLSTIAKRLGVSESTVSRELRRNRSKRGYRAGYAHRKAQERLQSKAHKRFSDDDWAYVNELLRKDWSPEQISLWLKKYGTFTISHEHIYQHILCDKKHGGDLHKHLRSQRQRKRRYGSSKDNGHLRNRVFIDERPESVERRLIIGHWEVDLVMGRKSRRPLLTLVERKSRLTLVAQVARKSAGAVRDAMVKLLMPFKQSVRTITSDNGLEFAYHEQVAELLEAKFYFAHPYHSWERGTNENTNGLLRQYFPRSRDFTTIKKSQIIHATDRLNNRPRKCLDMETPNQVFFKNKQRLALAN